jgi:uncharacterized protein (TIGR02118 family)
MARARLASRRAAGDKWSPMRKLIHLCYRRPDITHAQYVECVLGGHVPLALRHHPTMRRYVVNIASQELVPGPREVDAIPELSFATLADYRERLYDSPEGQAIIGRDVARFLDGASVYECSEHVRKESAPEAAIERPAPPASPGVKLYLCLKRKPELSHEDFVAYWLERHAPLVLEHGARLSKYVQNVVDARLSAGGEEYDGFAELHFASEADFAAQMAGHGQGSNPVQEDTAHFIAGMAVYRVAEHVARVA